MRTLVLFSALQNNLPAAITESSSSYTINNGFIDFKIDMSIGIYVEDVAPSRMHMSGQKYTGHSARVQFLLQTGQTSDSYFTAQSIMQDIEDYLNALQSTVITTGSDFELLENGKIHRVKSNLDRLVPNANGINLVIRGTQLLSGILDKGKTEEGRKLLSLNAGIVYDIDSNNIVNVQQSGS